MGARLVNLERKKESTEDEAKRSRIQSRIDHVQSRLQAVDGGRDCASMEEVQEKRRRELARLQERLAASSADTKPRILSKIGKRRDNAAARLAKMEAKLAHLQARVEGFRTFHEALATLSSAPAEPGSDSSGLGEDSHDSDDEDNLLNPLT